MKKSVLILFLSLFFVSGVSAINPDEIVCSDINTFCAESASLLDVQSAVNSALASSELDVIVFIPQEEVTWVSGTRLSISTGSSKKLRLIGAGISSTIITHFQIDLPVNGMSNLVEVGHFTAYGAPEGLWSNFGFMDYRIRPFNIGDEIYWHDLVIDRYGVNYNLHFEGWHGVVSNVNLTCRDRSGQNPYGITIHGDGKYSNHLNNVGSGNALFIEDSTFNYCGHSISLFCNAYVVFRNNTVNNADSYLDIHGPGYNFCFYGNPSPEDKHGGGGFEIYNNNFYNFQSSWYISPRAGSAGIITGNSFHNGGTYAITLQAQETCTQSINCGEGDGKTYDRVYSYNEGDGCLQMLENWFIWDNICYETIRCNPFIYVKSDCGNPLRENIDYFLRAPNLEQDGFTYTPYQHPHPLRLEDSNYVLPPDTTPPTISNQHPTGNLPAGTTSTTISLTTDENAVCRYSNISGTKYSLMQNIFTTTGETSHSQLIINLQNSTNYNFYIRCNDTFGNYNEDDFEISFSINQNFIPEPIDENLIINGDFELGFNVSGIANYWKIGSDNQIEYTLSQDSGYNGSSQKIEITQEGQWGLFIYQEPNFEINEKYKASFWYKSENEFNFQITNAQHTEVIYISLISPSASWKKVEFEFEYNNAQADMFRFATNNIGTFWIDKVVLEKINEPEKPIKKFINIADIVTLNQMLESYNKYQRDELAIEIFLEMLRKWIILG